jgi:hypothetical protein
MGAQAAHQQNVYTVEVLYLARNSRLSIFRSKTLSIEANLTNAYHVKTFVWMFLVVLQLLFRPKQKV